MANPVPESEDKVKLALARAVSTLEDVLKEQEQATVRIAGLAERIFSSSREEPTRLQAEAIMEACTFQDFTGQKIQKVARFVQYLRENGFVEVKNIQQEAAPLQKKGLTQEEINRLLRGGKPVIQK